MAHRARTCRALFTAFVAALAMAPTAFAAPPNIVYILADDLGWADVGFHGGSLRTPNLDRLAAGGAILNACYVQPYSTQTRAAVLTGRYPARYGLQTLSITPRATYGLPADEPTLAQVLKGAGYRTAFLGTWRLGHAKPDYWPTRRGFDVFYGSLSGRVDGLLRKGSKADWYRGEKPARETGYVTDLLAREAQAIIQRHDAAVPLFMVVAFDTPAQYGNVPRALFDSHADIPDDTRRSYAAAVSAFDDAVGRIVDALAKRGLSDNTLVILHSDNGGAIPARYPTGDGDVRNAAADNGRYRGGKGSLHEGGIRVVAIASWPSRVPPGSTVTDPIHVTDLHATIRSLAGVAPDAAHPLDGFDVWPVLAERARTPRKEMLLNVDDFQGAIRAGEWKLILRAALPSKVELFDIANDPEEAENAAEAYPDRVRELSARLNEYALDMAPSLYLDAAVSAGEPVFWLPNPPRR